ncbi:MAG: hypothetical protein AB7P02_19735 [Alphaproteobacteria bacterium]
MRKPRLLAAGNRWGRLAAVELRVDDVPLVAERLADARLERIWPGLAEALGHCPMPRTSGSAPWAEALARLALGLLRCLSPVDIHARVDARRWPAAVVVGCFHYQATVDALRLALRLLDDRDEATLAAIAGRFVDTYSDALPARDQWMLMQGLAARGLGWRHAEQETWWRDLAFGEGFRRRRLRQTITDRTSEFAGALAERKDLCSRFLAHHLFPVPEQRAAEDAAAAVAAADAIGYPVVVKPIDRSGGVGVAAGLTDAAAVVESFRAARRHSAGVVVEAFLPGHDYRVLVIGGRVVAAAWRRPARVVGDGVRDVTALVAAANADPQRRRGGNLKPIVLDAESDRLLAARSWTRAAVPAEGEVVPLRSAGNHAQGGDAIDVTARVHPDNVALARQAALVIGLDVAGVDLVLPDIARSWRETGGGICEVNRLPSLLVHATTASGPVAVDALLDHVVPSGEAMRIPIVAVLGEGADEIAAEAAGSLTAAGLAVGAAHAGGLDASGLPLADPGPGEPERVRLLVDDPASAAVVVAVPPRTVLALGFGHDRCDLAVSVDPDVPPAVLRLFARLGAEVATFSGADARSQAVARIVARCLPG